jgi:hypothetical protein
MAHDALNVGNWLSQDAHLTALGGGSNIRLP